MVDKKFCMSSYLAFRYIEKDNIDFFDGINHKNYIPISNEKKILVKTSNEIGENIKEKVESCKGKKLGILLSGGMDSAIIASYMSGHNAYTFRFLDGEFQKEELARAEYYAKYYNLNLEYVDINWNTVERYLDDVMKTKGMPVHSIEPQILQAALQAKNDGVEIMFTGAISDLTFGGMDQLLSKDWTFEEFKNRYSFTKPEDVLKEYSDVSYLFERYKFDEEHIDFLKFMDEVSYVECSSSYLNAFSAAKMDYIDPYSYLKMEEKLDLKRIRSGESKYLIRELMKSRYPEIDVPNKIPMPRPVDIYFKSWEGPKRYEFKKDLDMSKFTGNQKWQIYCLEKFLDLFEN